ncbi:MAG: insulinase family protein, partial [Deltaproteobacteria bacterium]|nr:insulinase family protein [Deltaproteobacteria bacterium]
PSSPAIKVVSTLSSTSPIVDVRVVFRAGSADDPAGREGLTRLSARLMAEATVDHDAAALAAALFPLAAELSVQVDKDATVFVGRVHKDHVAAFVPLFLDVLLRPRLDAGDFARLKDDARAEIMSTLRTGADEALQREALEAALYDPAVVLGDAAGPQATTGHPYRHTPTGTVQGLDAITLDDLRAHIGRVFTADRVVLGMGGAATAATTAALTAALQRLPATSPARAVPVLPARAGGAKLLVVQKPTGSTAISLGFALPTLSRSHPDYAALKLAETWFGEHRNLIGHLFHSMREVRGLNYGDYAYVEHFVQDGWSTLEQLNIPRRTQYFSLWIRPVQHDNKGFALRMAAWELQKFAAAGIPDDDSFRRVQSFVSGYWRSKEQEPMRRLGYAIDEALTGMPFDRAGLRHRVATLTRAEVNAAIARHLSTADLTYVVVTDSADALVDALVGDKPTPATYASPMSAAVQKEDAEIVAFDLGLTPKDVVVVPSSALFER